MIVAHLFNLAVLTAAVLLAWWLSGFDSKLTHDDRAKDFTRRGIRCGVTFLLLAILFWLPQTVLGIPIFLGVIWAGCLAELAARWFHWLIDPEDKRVFDPARHLRELDAVAGLIRNGKKAEAIQLCQQLKAAGEVDAGALALTLEHLGVPQTVVKNLSPLTEAGQLRQQGKFREARLILDSLLAKNPRNFDAAMLLVRLYAQDMQAPGKAQEILRALEKQPHISASHIDFARRSIDEWSKLQPEKTETVAAPKAGSVDELLEQKLFGSAIETLEEKIKAQPQDFAMRLKLAEIHAVHCGNFQRAEKIISHLEAGSNFSTPQIESARAKLKAWREAGPVRTARLASVVLAI
jgi:thioredoxin-like negative regulator of GroEL